jgi:hypothetical protein
MENSGNSEFSNSNNQRYSMTFWQTFLLTLFGAAGLISMVVDGPRWITYPSFIIVIIVLFPLASASMKKKK